jgi:hypothetical protein
MSTGATIRRHVRHVVTTDNKMRGYTSSFNLPLSWFIHQNQSHGVLFDNRVQHLHFAQCRVTREMKGEFAASADSQQIITAIQRPAAQPYDICFC